MAYRFLLILILSGCASTTQTHEGDYSGLSWSMAESDLSNYDTVYTLGVCRVHTKNNNSVVRFEAQNPHWPEGLLTWGTTIEKDSEGNFEASHSHTVLFNLKRNKEYPEYPFTYESYDVFYSLCFKAAQVLPENVQEFLKKYSTETYKEHVDSQKENFTARLNGRAFS